MCNYIDRYLIEIGIIFMRLISYHEFQSSSVHNLDVAKSFEAAAFQFYMVVDVCHVMSYWQGKNKTNWAQLFKFNDVVS